MAPNGSLAARWLVTAWLAAWLADQPAGRLAAGWLAPMLPRCPAALLAGQPANPRSGPLAGFLLAACLSGLPSFSFCTFFLPG